MKITSNDLWEAACDMATIVDIDEVRCTPERAFGRLRELLAVGDQGVTEALRNGDVEAVEIVICTLGAAAIWALAYTRGVVASESASGVPADVAVPDAQTIVDMVVPPSLN